jgi:hypothetical protein
MAEECATLNPSQPTMSRESAKAWLGRILSLSTQPGYNDNPGSVEVMLRGGETSSRTKVVEPQIPVTVTVSGRWELVSTP